MSPQDFCYWLRGFVEVSKPLVMTEEETAEIKAHLDRVFTAPRPVPEHGSEHRPVNMDCPHHTLLC